MANIIDNNIYGGAIIPSSFVFDFVHYGSYKTLTELSTEGEQKTPWETMTIGRHCLIKYCNYAFTTEERKSIEENNYNDFNTDKKFENNTISLKDYADKYYACFKTDGNRSYDGLIVQKTKDGPLMIGYTNHGINTDDLAADIEGQVAAANITATNAQTSAQNAKSAADNAKSAADKAQEVADKAIETLGYEFDENNNTTVDERIEKITTEIGTVNDENTDEKTTIYGSINKISTALTSHTNDFNSRTTWEQGVTLSLGTIVPTEDTPGRITVNDGNIYYNQQILSRDSWFNEAETAGAKYGAFPQVQVEGIAEKDLKDIPVKIYIGSTAPTSTEDDITIWIKTSN